MIEPYPHVHVFIWVCDDNNHLICRCPCGAIHVPEVKG